MARSLLAERRRVGREQGERLPLRRLFAPGGAQELARRGGRIDPDLAFRALEHLIDPAWTRGERFAVSYELSDEGGGRWTVIVDDGSVRVLGDSETLPDDAAASNGDGTSERRAVVMLAAETWRKLAAGELSPTTAMQFGLTEVEGDLHAVTLLGRWIDRANGLDAPELERERQQRELQAIRRSAVRGRGAVVSCSTTRISTRSGSAPTGGRTSSTSRSIANTGWPRPARRSATRHGRSGASMSARSG